MAHTQAFPFLGEEGKIVIITKESLKYTQFLEMLYRNRKSDDPIKTEVCENDLLLTQAICEIGYYPCVHQTLIRPSGFDNFHTFLDYMGIDLEEDTENVYINDFLNFFGLEEEEWDEEIDPYEGWTPEMIAEQLEDDKREELRMMAELEEICEPDYDDDWPYY